LRAAPNQPIERCAKMPREIEDIRKFEAYLNNYETEETEYSVKYLSLEKWVLCNVSSG
jgi:hypothetical protein